MNDHYLMFNTYENWSDVKLHALPTELLDYQIGIVTQPIVVTKVHNNNYDDSVPSQTLESASFENTIYTQLTPPQSPPQSIISASPALETTKNINNDDELPLQRPHGFNHNHQEQHPATSTATAALPHENFNTWDNGSHTPANDDIARDVQIVDDILNSRAKELFNWHDECESQSSLSTLSQTESNIDEEWYPECSSYSASVSSASSSPARSSSGDSDVKPHTRTAPPKKRTRAYGGRGVEDRKNRKKEQNKNAATRYRQKKKIEMENVQSEEQTLSARNDDLLKILADCTREQKYLKSLIREFHANKKKK